jgi:hypothetical protein
LVTNSKRKKRKNEVDVGKGIEVSFQVEASTTIKVKEFAYVEEE